MPPVLATQLNRDVRSSTIETSRPLRQCLSMSRGCCGPDLAPVPHRHRGTPFAAHVGNGVRGLSIDHRAAACSLPKDPMKCAHVLVSHNDKSRASVSCRPTAAPALGLAYPCLLAAGTDSVAFDSRASAIQDCLITYKIPGQAD